MGETVQKKISPSSINFIILVVGSGLFFVGLILFAYLGIFNRYWADDWCYNADLKNLGFIGTLKGYSYITTYASNRYSLTFVSGMLYQLGVLGVQIMTPLIILFWLIGICWILYNIKRITNFSCSILTILLSSSIILYYCLYAAPHLYQSIYWRTGLLCYTAPLVLSCWIFGLITTQCVLEKPSRLIMSFTALLTFLAGGFSEAASAYLATSLILYLFAASVGVYRKRLWAVRSLPTAGIALIFVILAMVLLVLSPTSEMRMARYGEPASLMKLPFLVFYYAYQFIRLSILDLPLPHLVLFITFVSLAFLLNPLSKQSLQYRSAIFFILTTTVIAFLLIAASYAPSAYIEQWPPALRTRIIPRFIMLVAVSFFAGFIGSVIRKNYSYGWFNGLAIILILFAFVYTVRSIIITSQKVTLYAYRASVWDERDQIIRQAKEQNINQVDVRALDSSPVGNINDLKVRETHWINSCAERYYGVEIIRASLP